MAVYSLKSVQTVPVSLEVAWKFFSDPANLASITPSNLGFKIISHHHGTKMYPGQIIEYTVAPLWKIPVYWMTEITHVEPHRYFVDEQRYGPYAMWHHQHHFTPVEDGVEMSDIVHYKMPLGFLGSWMNGVVVRRELTRIFEFRYRKVIELFGDVKGQSMNIRFY